MSDFDFFLRLADLDIDDASDAAAVVFAHRRRFVVPVRQPLALVTQIQRSGGTLITQLLDGHTGLHVHASELHIGKPKHEWPELDPAWPAPRLFQALREKRSAQYALQGYWKLSPAEIASNANYRQLVRPFMFLVDLQKELFERLVARDPPRTQRDVLDAYITSYFNAWLDYAGLYRRPESVKYWVAFAPRMTMDVASIERFVADYPDGRVIVPVRDPVSWYASARAHTPEYAGTEAAIDLWLRCNENTLLCADRWPGMFLFTRFEDLVERTQSSLDRLLGFLGLGREPVNAEPTFNGMPIVSDSSFGSRYGIDQSVVDRGHLVSEADRSMIVDRTQPTYRRLLERAA